MRISLPGYVNGKATLTKQSECQATLAHFGPRNLFTPGKTYNIADKIYLVLKNAQSQYVKGITLVQLQEIS